MEAFGSEILTGYMCFGLFFALPVVIFVFIVIVFEAWNDFFFLNSNMLNFIALLFIRF